jgi:4-amino-4-deoxy-L-arabinose transferase-like glycosyltransferase
MSYLADAALILVIACALIAGSWGAISAHSTLPESTALGLGTSLGLTACILAFCGATGQFGLGFALLFIFPLGWLSRTFYHTMPAMRVRAHRFKSGVLGLRGLDLLLTLYLFLIFAFILFLTLAPPSANDYDSLVYHLAAPAQYLRAGRILELPYDHHSYFPLLTEMLFALGLAWKGPVLAKLFHWLMLPLSCMALIAMGSRHFSRRTGLIAAALFATIPLVQIEATTAYVDLSLCAFVLLAFLCFANWLESRAGWWLGWSGVFCGFALGVKYSGALFFLWLLAWASAAFLFDRKRTASVSDRLSLKSIVAFAVIAILIGGGWYLRNIFWTGNPVYPFAYEIFGGKGWTLEMAKGYARDQAAFGFGRGALDFLLLPWRLAMAPLNFRQPFWPLPSVPLQNGATGAFEVGPQVLQSFVGPPLLAFGLPLVFMQRKPRLIGFLLWTFAVFWVFWFATSQQIRYLLPTLALLCLCCGWGVLRLSARSALLKWTCALTLALWFVFVPAQTLWRMRDVLPVVSGAEAPEQYLARTFPGYSAMQWASQNTPQDARFAVYGEPRCFYLQRDYFFADDPHNNLIDYGAIHSGAQLVAALQKLGATHVLWNTQPERNGGFGGAPPQIEEAVSDGTLQQIFEARDYRVYRITGGKTR